MNSEKGATSIIDIMHLKNQQMYCKRKHMQGKQRLQHKENFFLPSGKNEFTSQIQY